MDSISSNPYFDSNRLNHVYGQHGKAESNPSERANPLAMQAKAVTEPKQAEAFRDLFDDSDLERLQKNLEAVADMAGKALERFGEKGSE